MRILVDADACPSLTRIEEVAKKHEIPLYLYFDTSHQIESTYAMCVQCDTGFQSVDMKMVNDIQKNDIIITQDYGVAGIALSKEAKALHPKGLNYTKENIDRLFLERYIHSKERKLRKGKGPKKRTLDDEKNLIQNLILLIEQTEE